MDKIFNPIILPEKKNARVDHNASTRVALAATIILLIIGVSFWVFTRIQLGSLQNQDQGSAIDEQASMRAQVISQLENANISPPTSAQRTQIINQLKNAKVPAPTPAERQAILDQLNNK